MSVASELDRAEQVAADVALLHDMAAGRLDEQRARRPPRSCSSTGVASCPALRVPIIHPCWSGGMLVFVEGAAESVPSADIVVRDPFRIGDRFR
jgi:hypothetical protein